jgi:hypothetical protein
MTFDQWMKANNPKHRKSDDTVALRLLRDTWEVAREAACAEIKAADDEASGNDYMLDSNDCISVIRGTWKGGD